MHNYVSVFLFTSLFLIFYNFLKPIENNKNIILKFLETAHLQYSSKFFRDFCLFKFVYFD